jgi:tetratricopeptide (TPR) repeat protein
VQALLREIAYQSLARPDRRARHLAAARYFEALNEGELAGVLANHYLDAFHASQPGAEADAVAAQARIALLAAADRAVSLHAHRNAISYLSQALTVTDDPAERARIHERAATAGEFAGTMETVIEAGNQAVETYRSLGDAVSTLRTATLLARNLIGFHLEDEARSTLRAAIEEAKPLGNIPELGAAYAELARAFMLNEQHDEAVRAADRALTLAGQHPWYAIEALITKGTSLEVIGRAIESEATLRGAIYFADRNGQVQASLRARNNLSGPISFRDLGEAIALMREGYEMAVRYGHRLFAYQFLLVLLEVELRSGNWDVWTSEADEFMASEVVTPFYASAFLSGRALRLALRGDVAAAEEIHGEVVTLTQQLQSQQLDAYVHREQMLLRFVAGRWEEAVDSGRIAAANSNFVVDAWWIVAAAAAAADLAEPLDDAIVGLDPVSFAGPTASALRAAATAARSARRGDVDAARAGFADGRERLLAGGELLFGHQAGLLWSRLQPGDREARAAGGEAEAFFAERGARSVIDTFDRAFVAPASGEARTQPAADAQATAEGRVAVDG